MDIHPMIMKLIVGYTCIGIFISTSLAMVLNLFGTLKIEASIRKKLQIALIVEVILIGVSSFSGLITVTPQKASERLITSAELAADRLEGSLDFIRKKGQQNNSESVFIGVKRAVFIEIPILKGDLQLLSDSLKILELRGLTTQKINDQIKVDYPHILQEKLRWLQDKALPMIIIKEAEIEKEPHIQMAAWVSVEIPPQFKLSPYAKSEILLDRNMLEAEVKIIKSALMEISIRNHN